MIDFDKRLRSASRAFGDPSRAFACSACGEELRVRAPLIVDIPKRNLLVFVTHHGDDGGVEGGFRRFLDKLSGVLPRYVADRARSTPYTFVHGYRGLFALLDAFQGKDPQPNVSVGDGTMSDVRVLNGYQYGKLFFYFPCHIGMRAVISTSVSAAIDLEHVGNRSEAISLLQALVLRIGVSHPWLPMELGRLLLAHGDKERALLVLGQANESSHSWHAVTASFMDFTPRRREDGDTQREGLPSASVFSGLGDITAQRHTVLGFFPAQKDVGLWDFPKKAEAGIPEQYTLENFVSTYAYSLGRIDHYMTEEFRDHAPLEPTRVGWYHLLEDARSLVQQHPQHEAFFWTEFTRSRWPDAWSLKGDAAGVEASKLRILELLALLPRDEKQGARSKGRVPLGGVVRLESAAREARSL
jgi:hypothetical protein